MVPEFGVDAAKREYLEESGLTLKDCMPIFLLSIGGESEVVCFGHLFNGELKSGTTTSSDEEMGSVSFISREKIINKLGNQSLWKPIINSFYEKYLPG